MQLALAFTATVTTNLANYSNSYDKLADGQSFDPGTSTELANDCEEFIALSAEAPEVYFDWGQDIAIKTVYLMGSVLNNGDLIGLQIQIQESASGAWISCPTVDGSGFYSCSVVGRNLKLLKTALGSKFTICQV